ncbi:MAG: cytochrome c [Nitrospirae bacterium]|nr:cytochrome c [Nitrospirota bacterium]
MKRMAWGKTALFVGMAGVFTAIAGCEAGEGPIVAPPPPPAEYADKHMPAGWWADDKIVEEGRQIFIGANNPDVNCASCHGKDGKPVKAGARDMRNTERMKLYSDSVWFWRISEGVPKTKMKPWKSKLSEEDRWKLVAFERTFGLKGQEWDPVKLVWIPIGTASAAGSAPASTGDKAAGEKKEGAAPATTPTGGATAPAPATPKGASAGKRGT